LAERLNADYFIENFHIRRKRCLSQLAALQKILKMRKLKSTQWR